MNVYCIILFCYFYIFISNTCTCYKISSNIIYTFKNIYKKYGWVYFPIDIYNSWEKEKMLPWTFCCIHIHTIWNKNARVHWKKFTKNAKENTFKCKQTQFYIIQMNTYIIHTNVHSFSPTRKNKHLHLESVSYSVGRFPLEIYMHLIQTVKIKLL